MFLMLIVYKLKFKLMFKSLKNMINVKSIIYDMFNFFLIDVLVLCLK